MPGLAFGHKFEIAVAKQTAEGTPATTADYSIPVFSGIMNPGEERAQHDATGPEAYRPGSFKKRADAGGSPVFGCFPNSLGRLAFGHLGSDTVTGSVDPWTHTMIRADNMPWETIWAKRPKVDGTFQWDRFEDAFFKSLEWQWATGMPLRVATEILAKKGRVDVAAPTVTTTNKYDNAEKWHHSIASTLKLDLDTTPAATQIRNVQSFTLRAAYADATLEQTDELHPRFRDLGLWSTGFSADVLLEDYAAYKATFFGSKTATDVPQSGTILVGAIDFTIDVGPAADANRTLQFLLPAQEFFLTPPEVDPSGKGLRATLTAALAKPASGEPFTLKLKNALSAAY